MMPLPLARRLLQARLALRRLGSGRSAVVLLCSCGLLAWVWLLAQGAPPALAPVPAPALSLAGPAPVSKDNLLLFYDTLGDVAEAEQGVSLLFAQAANNGLVLEQGDYKLSSDPVSRFSRYQIVLPLKGSYQAIWQFALQSLAALPFAALDEISFKRDAISDALPEARLHFSLYLKPSGRPGPP